MCQTCLRSQYRRTCHKQSPPPPPHLCYGISNSQTLIFSNIFLLNPDKVKSKISPLLYFVTSLKVCRQNAHPVHSVHQLTQVRLNLHIRHFHYTGVSNTQSHIHKPEWQDNDRNVHCHRCPVVIASARVKGAFDADDHCHRCPVVIAWARLKQKDLLMQKFTVTDTQHRLLQQGWKELQMRDQLNAQPKQFSGAVPRIQTPVLSWTHDSGVSN